MIARTVAGPGRSALPGCFVRSAVFLAQDLDPLLEGDRVGSHQSPRDRARLRAIPRCITRMSAISSIAGPAPSGVVAWSLLGQLALVRTASQDPLGDGLDLAGKVDQTRIADGDLALRFLERDQSREIGQQGVGASFQVAQFAAQGNAPWVFDAVQPVARRGRASA